MWFVLLHKEPLEISVGHRKKDLRARKPCAYILDIRESGAVHVMPSFILLAGEDKINKLKRALLVHCTILLCMSLKYAGMVISQ
jgi:hypothetical protein